MSLSVTRARDKIRAALLDAMKDQNPQGNPGTKYCLIKSHLLVV
jgi:hypothetical protein